MERMSENDILKLAADPIQWARWLNEHDFINIDYRYCTVCDHPLTLERCASASDGAHMRCTKYKCKTSQTIRTGSFFADYHFPISLVLRVLLFFLHSVPRVKTAALLGIDRHTVAKIFDAIQDRIADNVRRHPVVFPSKGIYEVDETPLEHVKLFDGSYAAIVWVGGILHRDTGRVVLFRLPDRSAPTLIDKIETYIPEGSLVCTDKWKSYKAITTKYIHYDVNHSKDEYVKDVDDPVYGRVTVTTNHLENMWHRYKSFLMNKQLRTMDRVLSGSTVFMYQNTARAMFDLVKMRK
jgi:hypothetical protein